MYNEAGDEPRKQDTQANKGSPLVSEEVPYQITLIGLSQGSLDRRREKVIWEMFSENDCNTFADLKGKSWSKIGGDGRGSPRRLMGKWKRHEEVGASAYVFDEGLSLSTKGTKGRNYKGDFPHASTRRGPPGRAKVVTGTGNLQGTMPVKSWSWGYVHVWSDLLNIKTF